MSCELCTYLHIQQRDRPTEVTQPQIPHRKAECIFGCYCFVGLLDCKTELAWSCGLMNTFWVSMHTLYMLLVRVISFCWHLPGNEPAKMLSGCQITAYITPRKTEGETVATCQPLSKVSLTLHCCIYLQKRIKINTRNTFATHSKTQYRHNIHYFLHQHPPLQ